MNRTKIAIISACILLLVSCGSVTEEQWQKQAEREAQVQAIIEKATKGELKIDTIGAIATESTVEADSTAQ